MNMQINYFKYFQKQLLSNKSFAKMCLESFDAREPSIISCNQCASNGFEQSISEYAHKKAEILSRVTT